MIGQIVFLSRYQGAEDYEYASRTNPISRISNHAIEKLAKHHDIRKAYARYRAEKREAIRAYCIKNKFTPEQFWKLVKSK